MRPSFAENSWFPVDSNNKRTIFRSALHHSAFTQSFTNFHRGQGSKTRNSCGITRGCGFREYIHRMKYKQVKYICCVGNLTQSQITFISNSSEQFEAYFHRNITKNIYLWFDLSCHLKETKAIRADHMAILTIYTL